MPALIPDDDYSACGSIRGRARHLKRGEPVCGRCHQAYLAYKRAWYLANKTRLKLKRVRAELAKAA